MPECAAPRPRVRVWPGPRGQTGFRGLRSRRTALLRSGREGRGLNLGRVGWGAGVGRRGRCPRAFLDLRESQLLSMALLVGLS